MYQGTTATHIFELPFSTDTIQKCRVTYAQNDTVEIQKETEECDLSGNTITVNLREDETMFLNHRTPLQIQLRVLTDSGEVLASDILAVDVRQSLDLTPLTEM